MQQLFIPFEVEQILRISIISLTENDCVVWAAMAHRGYTIKSTYSYIREWGSADVMGGSGIIDNEVWGKLWKLGILPMETHFIWRVLNEIIPVPGRLNAKGV